MDMYDLENNLPDELMSSSSWALSDNNMGNTKPPAQGPGPGGLQNGIDNADGNNLRTMQINHIIQQVRHELTLLTLSSKPPFSRSQQSNKGLVNNALALAGQLGSKSPNLQSPPNVSVTKGNVVDQMTLGSLPSSISNNAGFQSIANNGSSQQIMSSIQGINNSGGGNMIMTNSSNINTIGGMGGGGLVVSSSVNKNAPNMLAPGQQHHPGNHNVQQQVRIVLFNFLCEVQGWEAFCYGFLFNLCLARENCSFTFWMKSFSCFFQ